MRVAYTYLAGCKHYGGNRKYIHVSFSRSNVLEARFKSLDLDSSGDLDTNELLGTLMLEAKIDHDQAIELVKQYDIDQSGTIDAQEFIAMWTVLKG